MRTTGIWSSRIDSAHEQRPRRRETAGPKPAAWPMVLGLLALPSYAAAQDLPTTPPSGYYDAVASNPKGTVDNVTYGSDYVARVYTPPGYSTSRKYPAMYLLHGAGGSERSWHDNDLYAHIQLDNLIAQGTVDPFIIVFTRNDYANWSGFGSILINELIPFVEERYSVCANPENRALGGLSMGGMQTINFGFPNADKFHYLMPSSPAPGIQGQSQLFPNGGALAKTNLKLIFFTCGSGEVGNYGCNNANTVRDYAKSNGLESIIEELIVQGGGHNAATWRPSFWNFAQLAHEAGFTTVGDTCGMGGTGGMTGTGGKGGAGGMTTGGAAAGGANGGSGTMGGRSATGGATTGTGGAAGGVGGTTAQGGTAGSPGAGMTAAGMTGRSGAANGTGGATAGAGGTTGASGSSTTAGASMMTGGVRAATGGATSTPGDAAPPPGDDNGCGCSVPGSRPPSAPFLLFAAAVAAGVGRLRARRRRNFDQ
jgi:MYXO-CTERM domain-containing protein